MTGNAIDGDVSLKTIRIMQGNIRVKRFKSVFLFLQDNIGRLITDENICGESGEKVGDLVQIIYWQAQG